MDRTAERKILSKIATAVGAAAETLQPAPVTGFLSMKGDSYQGELMWVGRAVNGWTKGWTPMELREPDNVAAFVETVCKSVSGESGKGQTCPMRWVSAFWGNKDSYNTNRSAFWRTARRTIGELKIADVEQDNWPSHMVWSNLYKVAPEAGWNPNGQLAKVQREKCRELLLHEISALRPKRLVFATGSDWAAGLLDSSCFVRDPDMVAGRYTRQAGNIVIDGDVIGSFIVADHPMGKDETVWVREVKSALS
ncbi:hypothetical protein [Microvirga aerophila]|uniref:Uncharacterized protein n=1 Tax=Microvirga aerophila TaxID=670291 RepID=A0A512BX27_9HYPH|nr:hypothetical protein [Microvirga aerophila]GEO16510.1 hypothetical protein MAE02_42060 [Microvirga aerophila]